MIGRDELIEQLRALGVAVGGVLIVHTAFSKVGPRRQAARVHRGAAGAINRVDDHIDTHMAEPLDLEKLAAVAHFSPWHFHRLFLAPRSDSDAPSLKSGRLLAGQTRRAIPGRTRRAPLTGGGCNSRGRR